mgnify:CR=1 FL=1
MKMIKIREIIADELKILSIEAEGADLEHPKSLANGDFSFFVKDKSVNLEKLFHGKPPLKKIDHEYVEKTEIAGRFINFYLSKKFFADILEEILATEKNSGITSGNTFGKNDNLTGQKIIIEYTDPNLFKEFHIGHLMSNVVGESLSRIIEWNGAKVTRAIYQSDVGLNIAKAIWGMREQGMKSPQDQTEYWTSQKIIEFIGLGYIYGSQLYEDSSHEDSSCAKKEIDELNKVIYEKSNPEINRLYDWGRKISLEHFEEIYKKLGTNFDLRFFESEAAPVGLLAAEELLKKGILEKSEGAVVFKGEQYGLHTRVFVNSQGLPTYETKELGLSKMKFDRQDFARSIVVTANEQNDYFDVVLKVLEFVDHRAANRTRHVSHGMLRFAEGKMSSRKGNVITGESLISDVEKLVQEKIKDRDLPASEKAKIAEWVAVGAIKYSILKQSPGRDIIFDFNKSLSFEGDSGPYLQYTHARACSVLKKADEEGIESKVGEALKLQEPIGELERLMIRFPEMVERAQKESAPQLITTFLTNFASTFNRYYAENIIVDKTRPESSYRVALVRAGRAILKSGLYLLGTEAPERM